MAAGRDWSRAQLAAYLLAAVLAVVAAVRFVGPEDDEPAEPVTVEPGDEGRAGGGGSGRLYVHVAGAVRDQGLYRMRAGDRVGAAIDRAGGPGPGADLAGVNLAAELQDGQQVLVPRRGDAAPATGTSGEAAGSPEAPLSLAQATPEELDASVDGIGPVLAAAIVEFRDENGGVGSIDELREVDGIGDERLATLRESLVP